MNERKANCQHHWVQGMHYGTDTRGDYYEIPIIRCTKCELTEVDKSRRAKYS